MARRYRNITRDAKPPRRRPLEGMERHSCLTHGFLADALPGSTSWCPCGRLGKIFTTNTRSKS